MWKGKKKLLLGHLELENFHFNIVNPSPLTCSKFTTKGQSILFLFFPFFFFSLATKPALIQVSCKAAQTNCSSSDYPFQGSGDMPPWVIPSMLCGLMWAVSFYSIPLCKKIFMYESHQVPFPLGMVLREVFSCQRQAVNRWSSWDNWTAGRKPGNFSFPSVTSLSQKTTRCVTVG